ncbi:MAG TPA: cyclic nucleotide-binding domain-containing protein [Actinomycetota bacterium]|jgi:CRP-like cAMP-binding protein|nr:cyclic nucleotide-binding domain-containing protein [Actinomycetota bacterium]
MTLEHDLVLAELGRVPLFSGLDDDGMDRVARVVSEAEAPAGHVLVQPAQPGTGMFVLQEGTAKVELPDRDIELGPGEFFGELAILADGIPRTARVQAVSAVRCLAISRRDFAALLDECPQIAVAMLPVLAQRLADTDRAHH